MKNKWQQKEAVALQYDKLSLKMSTTAPAFIAYSGFYNNWYKDTLHGPYSGMAFEPARYVDAINHPDMRDTIILKKGDKYY
jgi:galactose mutarotase-like enzyme